MLLDCSEAYYISTVILHFHLLHIILTLIPLFLVKIVSYSYGCSYRVNGHLCYLTGFLELDFLDSLFESLHCSLNRFNKSLFKRINVNVTQIISTGHWTKQHLAQLAALTVFVLLKKKSFFGLCLTQRL